MTSISAPEETRETAQQQQEETLALDVDETLHDHQTSHQTAISQPQPNPTPLTSATALIKSEQDVSANNHDHHNPTSASAAAADGTATLRPQPQPSVKRRESEAALSTPEPDDKRPAKKRKRAASPPWNFGSAETATLKTADGRRISARFNTNTSTPGLSEAEDRNVASRGRSVSTSQSQSRSRPPSPPWKKFEAEGPTTLQVDGKRKSGRVNKELSSPQPPKRISPRTKKHTDKLLTSQHGDRKPVVASKSMGASKQRAEPQSKKAQQVNGVHRTSSSASSDKKIAELQAQIAALQPTRSFPAEASRGAKTAHKRKQSRELKHERSTSPPAQRRTQRHSNADHSPAKPKSSPKLKLRLSSTRARHVIPPPHPNARMPLPAMPPQLSLYQLIDQYDLKELQQPYMENERGPPDADFFRQRADRQAVEEGAMRQRLLKEADPGGALSKDHLSLYQDDRQPEPPQQYGHHDHLVAHTVFLRHLQQREKANHRQLAKKIAYEALEKWKTIHGPTEEDLVAEQNKVIELIKRQVVMDMQAKWSMVEAHVHEMKKKAWELEQERIRAEKLQKKLEWSENLLAKQRGDADSDIDMDQDSTGDVEDSAEDSEEDEEENMSESESEVDEHEAEEEAGEMNEEQLAAYLAQQNTEPPNRHTGEYGNTNVASDNDEEVREGLESMLDPMPRKRRRLDEEKNQDESAAPTQLSRDASKEDAMVVDDSAEVDQEPFLSSNERAQEDLTAMPAEPADDTSDESTEMWDSDEDMSSTGDEADDGDENNDEEDDNDEVEEGPGLASLFSTKDLQKLRDGGLPTPSTSVENGDNDKPRPTSEARSDEQTSVDASAGVLSPDDAIQKQLEEQLQQAATTPDDPQESTPALDDATESEEIERASDTEDPAAKMRVPTPVLLRGTLRSYQHAGLDWLASLYRNWTNGILADEMGLGKTIQTIALLAHLAEVHEVWETHLVIVPTSVVLNWVTEFQKFLPGFRVLGYYGTAEERQFKRRGWTNDPHHEMKDKRGYNVVVTSYNVAMQDINAIRNVQWHYLILDEAHNIRNFNSQRWQTLIRLRTRARLLLTGTPLQNDLSEVWSLLTFLTAGDDDRSHGALEEFLSHWKEPVNEIFNQGVQKISDEAQRVVKNLHVSLRPYLLRRKKDEVEKDLPKKTESVVVCKLSKRQRQLYQDYMGLAETKATLAKGSGVQAGAVLLSLRRVCNHPDLFDPRPIQTSFAMESSPLEGFSIAEVLVRRLLGTTSAMPDKLMIGHREHRKRAALQRSRKLSATRQLQRELDEVESGPIDTNPDLSTLSGTRALQRLRQRERKLQQLRASIQATQSALDEAPVYGSDLRELVTIHKDSPYRFRSRRQLNAQYLQGWLHLGRRPLRLEHQIDWHLIKDTQLLQDVSTYDRYAERLQDTIVKFTFVPPAATVPILKYVLPTRTQNLLRASSAYPFECDFGHEARVRSSIAFPDSRLLIYDSGKLQRLVYLLRELQSRGSRSLIFTQMTGTLNVLEQFLNLLNLPYLRLDGSTPVERRQLYSAEFNRPDSKYQCMILSSRAGGVGLNLTGASSVIFYDLDWNPQMDRQCMDRAHRIGQVRDVEVYKMVSEKTVEENILRRANQKSLLDQTVIQEGHFTTEYQKTSRNQDSSGDDKDEVAAAIDRFLGGEEKNSAKALESVEDKEDVQAAQQAAKEDRQDDVDFAERSSKGPSKANTPGPIAAAVEDDVADERKGHVDLYMIRWMEQMLEKWDYKPPPVRRLDKHGRDPSHRPKRKR